jgi:hypothetical protein
VNFPTDWRPAGMHPRCRVTTSNVALKKAARSWEAPSVDILEGLSTGVNMDIFAPHLIGKWFNESRQSPSFMLGGLG